MKKILYFVVGHGYLLMALGMACILGGVFILFDERRRLGILRTVALGLALAGAVLYVSGRVCIVMERRLPKPTSDGEL